MTMEEKLAKIEETLRTISDLLPVHQQNVLQTLHGELSQLPPDNEAWRSAGSWHIRNFVTLVIERWPFLNSILTLFGRTQLENVADGQFGYRVSIAEMHRMYMRYLQIRLTKTAVALRRGLEPDEDTVTDGGDEHFKTLPALLQLYIQSVRDYDLMTKGSQQRKDLFVVSSEHYQDDKVLATVMPLDNTPDGLWSWKQPLFTASEKASATLTGSWERPDRYGSSAPIGSTRGDIVSDLSYRAMWSNLGEAVIGGAFLIGPCWLLALKRDLFFQLGAVTILVAGFGLLLALYVTVPGQVFAGTLAYAAVLVVFLGLVVAKDMDSTTEGGTGT